MKKIIGYTLMGIMVLIIPIFTFFNHGLIAVIITIVSFAIAFVVAL